MSAILATVRAEKPAIVADLAFPRVTHLRWLHRCYPVTSYADASASVLHTLGIWRNAVALDLPLLCAHGKVIGWVDSRGHCYLGRAGAPDRIEVYAPKWIEVL